MQGVVRWTIAISAFTVMFVGALRAGDWPGFRGPGGSGVAPDELPVSWSADNMLWKVKLPGPGASSPIVVGGKVFVTCYTGYGAELTKGMSGFGKGGFGKGGFGKDGPGKGPGKGEAESEEQKKLKLVLMCVDRGDGKTIWQKEVNPKLPEAKFTNFLREHGYASSTPVSDGNAIFCFFGKTGVVAFDMKGTQLWQADVGSKTDKWGTASSPVLYKNLVIVNAAIESGSLAALDKETGKEVWRTKGLTTSWTSPILVTMPGSKNQDKPAQEVVMSLLGKIVGYDPETGKELWHCKGIGNAGGFGYTCSTPVAKEGVVYVIGGGGPTAAATAIAVKAGGRGEVDETHVLWRQKAGSSIVSPVVAGNNLCWVAGSMQCLRTDTGKTVYNERVYEGRGEYVSAVVAGDKIFALTRFDGLYVLAGGDKFEQLAHNKFEGDASIFNASPAISAGRMFIRSNAYLYAIGSK